MEESEDSLQFSSNVNLTDKEGVIQNGKKVAETLNIEAVVRRCSVKKVKSARKRDSGTGVFL